MNFGAKWPKSRFLKKDRLWSIYSTNFCSKGLKRSVREGGPSKYRLFQCYVVLWINFINAICIRFKKYLHTWWFKEIRAFADRRWLVVFISILTNQMSRIWAPIKFIKSRRAIMRCPRTSVIINSIIKERNWTVQSCSRFVHNNRPLVLAQNPFIPDHILIFVHFCGAPRISKWIPIRNGNMGTAGIRNSLEFERE